MANPEPQSSPLPSPLPTRRQQQQQQHDSSPLQRTFTFSDRLKKSKIPLSFGVHDGFQSCFQLEKTILLKPQNVRLTVGAAALMQKKEISTYGQIEYDVPEKISILDFKTDVKTFQPTIVLDAAQIELKKKFKAFERNKFAKANVSVSCGYNYKKRAPFFKFEALPLNPLVLTCGAVGVMKEIGKASGKLEREIKLPRGARAKADLPVLVTRDKRTNHFHVSVNGSVLTVKLKEQMVTIGSANNRMNVLI